MQLNSRLKIAGWLLVSLSTSTGLVAQSAASDATPVPSFVASTVKPNTSGSGGSSSGLYKGRFSATNVTIRGLLRYEAFMIADARIVGGPKWMDTARFDIYAKLDPDDASHLDALPIAQKNVLQQALIQKLLADRFGLTTHWEDREMPVYALTVDKGGPKLKPAADLKHGTGWGLSGGKLQSTDVTLAQLADLFTQGAADDLGRVVVDRTGIAGAYDISLKWTPNNGAPSSDASTVVSIFTAMEEQLGLKLEPAKAPVKVLVVDHLDMPSEN